MVVMAYSLQKAAEIKKLVDDIGIDATAERTGLKRESVRRVTRMAKSEAREAAAAPIDKTPRDKMLEKLGEHLGDDEIYAILKNSQAKFTEGRTTEINFSGEWFRIGVLSDIHGGSKYLHDHKLVAAIEECNRAKCQELWLPGDITEGMSGRDGHIYEMQHIGYKAQRAYSVSRLKEFDGPIKAISGNHDLWYYSKGDTGALIVEDICRDLGNQATYLGEHEGRINLNGAACDLWHGEDGASYALSYRIQKIVESLGEESLPQLIIAGHDHKAEFIPDLRGIMAIESGCIEEQTPWMRRKKLRAFVGFWIIDICVRDGKIVRIKPEWISLKG
jgi:predicted phosphodiesterase